jgi:hypothetical protein
MRQCFSGAQSSGLFRCCWLQSARDQKRNKFGGSPDLDPNEARLIVSRAVRFLFERTSSAGGRGGGANQRISRSHRSYLYQLVDFTALLASLHKNQESDLARKRRRCVCGRELARAAAQAIYSVQRAWGVGKRESGPLKGRWQRWVTPLLTAHAEESTQELRPSDRSWAAECTCRKCTFKSTAVR